MSRLSKGLEFLLNEWPVQKPRHEPERQSPEESGLTIARGSREIEHGGGKVKVGYLRTHHNGLRRGVINEPKWISK